MDGVIVVKGSSRSADTQSGVVAFKEAAIASDASVVFSINRFASPASQAPVSLASFDGGRDGRGRLASLREVDGAAGLLSTRC